MNFRTPLRTALCLAFAVPAFATDGVLEINQACALASTGCFPGDTGGSFPVTLAQPGSYRLTSNLAPPGGTSGIVLNTADVHIDLNGFAIVGPLFCAPISCPVGTGSGIETPSIQLGVRSSVVNGRVQGMGKDCIQLSGSARVSDVTVSQCGEDGIDAGGGSLVHDNVVQLTGRHGLYFGLGAGGFRGNMISSSGVRAGSGGISISGGPFGGPGAALGGNYCEDRRCSRTGAKRFYLSQNAATGAQATTACTSGFHMASIWEIYDTSALEYDFLQGRVADDSGRGPPSSIGWIRTGAFASTSAASGHANCNAYASDLVIDQGTYAALPFNVIGSPPEVRRWYGLPASCDNSLSAWCVED